MSLSKVPAASLSGLIPGPNTSQVNGVHANGAIPASYVPGFIYLDSTTTAATLPASTAVTAYSTVTLQNTTPGAFITISTAAGDSVFWNGGAVTSFPLAYLDIVELIQSPGFGWFLLNKGRNKQAGAVLQVVQTVKTDTFTTTSTGFVDAGLSVSITPHSAANKILVMVTSPIGMGGSVSGSARLLRDSTAILLGNPDAGYVQVSSANFYGGSADSNNNETCSIHYVDSPNTLNAITYKMQVASPQGGALWVNTLGSNISGQSYSMRSASTIIAMEIAG
jgi:hypothetical protein